MSTPIRKTPKTLKDRGLPDNSFFSLQLKDNSSHSEKDTSWAEISERREVNYFGSKKIVHVCSQSIKKIVVSHENIETSIDVPNECEVYQSVRAETIFTNNSEKETRILGRIIGIVKDGEVIEERFINGLEKKVEGLKK